MISLCSSNRIINLRFIRIVQPIEFSSHYTHWSENEVTEYLKWPGINNFNYSQPEFFLFQGQITQEFSCSTFIIIPVHYCLHCQRLLHTLRFKLKVTSCTPKLFTVFLAPWTTFAISSSTFAFAWTISLFGLTTATVASITTSLFRSAAFAFAVSSSGLLRLRTTFFTYGKDKKLMGVQVSPETFVRSTSFVNAKH